MIPRRSPKTNILRACFSSASCTLPRDFGIDETNSEYMLDAANNYRIDNQNQEKPSWRNLDCYM